MFLSNNWLRIGRQALATVSCFLVWVSVEYRVLYLRNDLVVIFSMYHLYRVARLINVCVLCLAAMRWAVSFIMRVQTVCVNLRFYTSLVSKSEINTETSRAAWIKPQKTLNFGISRSISYPKQKVQPWKCFFLNLQASSGTLQHASSQSIYGFIDTDTQH